MVVALCNTSSALRGTFKWPLLNNFSSKALFHQNRDKISPLSLRLNIKIFIRGLVEISYFASKMIKQQSVCYQLDTAAGLTTRRFKIFKPEISGIEAQQLLWWGFSGVLLWLRYLWVFFKAKSFYYNKKITAFIAGFTPYSAVVVNCWTCNIYFVYRPLGKLLD